MILWFCGLVSGISDLFKYKLNLEYLVAEGAYSEAQKYPIYPNRQQEFVM
jgi:hypothetical protein